MAAAIVFQHGECLCSQHVCRGSAASDILANNRRLLRYVHSLLTPYLCYGVCAHIPASIPTSYVPPRKLTVEAPTIDLATASMA